MKRNLIVIFILSIMILSIVHCFVENPMNLSVQNNIVYEPDDLLTVPEIHLEYGIAADSFRMEEGIIGRNQNLSQILSGYNISPSLIHQIALSPRDLFDARRIRAGNTYKIYFSNDSLNRPRYFIYKTDPVEYVRINLYDTIIIERGAKEVRQVVKSASGQINTSLWNAMTNNQIPPVMAIELSEIYAWNIDFFGLRRGDRFSVLYNENYVDSISAGVDHIIAAYFNHMGRDFYAIPFEQDSVLSFFDQDGNSLRRTFLKAPLRYSRISSGFSHSRLHPILRIRRPHHGVDYAAPVGTPVYAIGDGMVTETSYSSGAGRMVRIKHNSVYTSAYLHLRNYATGIKPNVWVSQGDVIGYVGSSGMSTGPHLDFRIWRNGQAVDPLSIEAPPVEPVKEENIEAYNRTKNIWMERLKQLTISHQ